jgi:ATP-dependent RNA helicase DeaD
MTDIPFMATDFEQLKLHPQLVQAVTELGFTTPTPIQIAVIPLMLAGHDVIGQAQTGTGKTAAFGLPMLHRLTAGHSRVQGLVLTPTRELAIQVAQAIHDFGRRQAIGVLPIYGGDSYGRQIGSLRRGVDIVVGTPGRLLDLIQRGVLDLSGVQTVVLDEADEMLSMGFIEDIEAILSETPAIRQTALFSATLPPEIRNLADRYMRTPQVVTLQQKLTVEAISQRYYLVHETDKLAALTRLFEVEPMTRALIFVRTRAAASELAAELSGRGFSAEGLSGELGQDERERVLNRFRQDVTKVLVATDVAARGLDIEHISHVVNFDLPEDPEVYVHRIGRTGRAGKSGAAISLVAPNEQWRLRKIEAFARQRIQRAGLPTVVEVERHRSGLLRAKVVGWLQESQRSRRAQEYELVASLLAEGHDPLDIAAAALSVVRAAEGQRPILPVRDVQEARSRPIAQPKSHQHSRYDRNERQSRGGRGSEPGMVSLLISKGRAHGVRPSDVVSTIAYHADIPGSTIGRINIQEQHTLVDVPEQYVARVLAKATSYRIHRQPIMMERAS